MDTREGGDTIRPRCGVEGFGRLREQEVTVTVNWRSVARQDRELRQEEQKAGEQLGRLRYSNTIAIDVTFAEYARQCDVSHDAVSQYAHAWEIRRSDPDASGSWGECLARAKYSSEQFAALDAVAKARGISHETARSTHSNEVRRVRQFAREAADKKGTSVAAEAAEVAQWAEKSRRAEHNQRAEREAELDYRYLEVERNLLAAKRDLIAALRVDALEFDEEMKELLTATLDQLRGVLDLVASKFVGASGIDWDGALANVLKGAE